MTILKLKTIGFGALYGLSTFVVAVACAWILLASNEYFYGIWHDLGGIEEAINEFGPQNRYKSGFAETTRQERVRLFSEISKAVHNKGQGLEMIFYHSEALANPARMLRQAEIIHLRDVANLISLLTKCMTFVCILWVVFSGWSVYVKKELPAAKTQLNGFVVLLIVLAICIILFGWDNIFNQVHIWIFPDNHQWFFYYQDSLMSTLMWAPNLFTYIGVLWLMLASLFFLLLLYLQSIFNRKVLKRPKN